MIRDVILRYELLEHTLMTAIFLSLSVKNQAVIGEVGRKKYRNMPQPMVRGPKIRKMTYKYPSTREHIFITQTHIPAM
jgi:hypothetical protein